MTHENHLSVVTERRLFLTTMNGIRLEGGRAAKTYTLAGDAIMRFHSVAGDFAYSRRLERFM